MAFKLLSPCKPVPESFSPPVETLFMIDRLIASYHQLFAQIATWYHASDLLTQYVIMVVSGVFILLLSMIMVFSKLTK